MGPIQTIPAIQSIQLWERLMLVTGDAGAETYYSCRVADILPDRLVISRPVYERGRSLLADNRLVDVVFTRADSAYAFGARIRETEPKSEDQMWLLELGAIQRLQRRRFVRIDKTEPVRYQILSHPLAAAPNCDAAQFITTRTVNISAGGMLIKAEQQLASSVPLRLDLSPSGIKNLPRYLIAVCRHCRTDDNQQLMAGIEFLLDEDLFRHFKSSEVDLLPVEVRRFDFHMQNALVAEIFAEQILMRQKGLL
jgi:c-di-GMP-binding flagellar brake protein YcgR